MRASMLKTTLCALVLTAVLSEPSWAIAAWARRYGVDCTMCHWRVNRLNETGKQFLLRGHRLPGEGSEVDGKSVSIDNYWSLTEKIRFADDENVNSKFDVEAFSLYVGGPLDEKLSFFAEQYLHESNSNGANREKLAEAYVSYHTATTDDYTSVRAGQIGLSLLHYHGTGARLAVSRPSVFNDNVASIRVGTTDGDAALFNTYRPRLRNYGIELGHKWSKSNVFASIGIMNGTGHAPPNINFDPNNSKELYFTAEKTFDTQGSSLGLFGHFGDAVLTTGAGTAPQSSSGPEESFRRFGLVGNYTKPNWALIGGYVWGTDDVLIDVTNTSGVLSGGTADGSVDSRGFFLEYDHLFNNTWSAYARYDYVQPDANDKFAGDATVKGPTIGASARLGKYTRLTGELRALKTGGASALNSFVIEGQWMY